MSRNVILFCRDYCHESCFFLSYIVFFYTNYYFVCCESGICVTNRAFFVANRDIYVTNRDFVLARIVFLFVNKDFTVYLRGLLRYTRRSPVRVEGVG